jgi:hypothetical protein
MMRLLFNVKDGEFEAFHSSSSSEPVAAPAAQSDCRLEVIGAGFGRTGTASLYAALNRLGYKTHHMFEVGTAVQEPTNHT